MNGSPTQSGGDSNLLKSGVLLALWWSASVGSNIFLKKGMRVLPQPLTASIFQLVVLVIVLRGYAMCGPFRPKRLQRRQWVLFIAPLAALKCLSSLSTQFSLAKVPLAYTHTVKATLPLFSVAFSRLLLGHHFSYRVLATLVPIVLGVVIASATEVEFDILGLLSALASVMVAAGQTAFVKGVLKDEAIDTLSLLLFTSEVALLGIGPIWWWADGADLVAGGAQVDGAGWADQRQALQWLAIAGLLNTVQTISAFAYLFRVSPVSYSVANVSKRVLVILLAMAVFGKGFHVTNCVGISITMIGVALYNREKMRGKETVKSRRSDVHIRTSTTPDVVLSMSQPGGQGETVGGKPSLATSGGNGTRLRTQATPSLRRSPSRSRPIFTL